MSRSSREEEYTRIRYLESIVDELKINYYELFVKIEEKLREVIE